MTQATGAAPGNLLGTGKNVPRIAMAHGISISTCPFCSGGGSGRSDGDPLEQYLEQ